MLTRVGNGLPEFRKISQTVENSAFKVQYQEDENQAVES